MAEWSPWEDLDPDLKRTYTGPDKGVGAHYAWSGNKKAGQREHGDHRVHPEGIDIALTFLKPFKSTSTPRFVDAPPRGTPPTWPGG